MDMTEAFRYFGALALVLALVGAAGLAMRRFGIPGIAGPGRRIAIVDSLMLGKGHRVCIVRCDGTEHVHRHRAAGRNAHLERARETVFRPEPQP